MKRNCIRIFVILVTFVTISIILLNIRIDEEATSNDREKSTNQFQNQIQPSSVKSYLDRYPFFLNCKNPYKVWKPGDFKPIIEAHNFSKPADKDLHDLRITRAVIFYFPIDKVDYFNLEFRWLYRSWINMLQFEPPKWRTDLIVFTQYLPELFDDTKFFFNQLNCTFRNLRRNETDMPMCTLLKYTPIQKRNFKSTSEFLKKEPVNYMHFFNYVDIFNAGAYNVEEFYKFLKESITSYNYVDSILIGFDGYDYFKKAGFDFLVRSDMDVFLTPLFATWLPRFCNDFYVGRGGYSNTFNSKRFRRIAHNVGLSYAGVNNLGSTWYSTPDQFRLVSYLTLLGMTYLNNEEFAIPERNHQVGTILWPDWHYGVLLLYGQHMALNHLIGSKQISVVNLENHLDYPSGNNYSIYNMLHIHVYHGENLFSKFVFKMGKYNITVDEIDSEKAKMVNWFALKMALEGRNSTKEEFFQMFSNATKNKI